jgi:hypothetical protein
MGRTREGRRSPPGPCCAWTSSATRRSRVSAWGRSRSTSPVHAAQRAARRRDPAPAEGETRATSRTRRARVKRPATRAPSAMSMRGVGVRQVDPVVTDPPHQERGARRCPGIQGVGNGRLVEGGQGHAQRGGPRVERRGRGGGARVDIAHGRAPHVETGLLVSAAEPAERVGGQCRCDAIGPLPRQGLRHHEEGGMMRPVGGVRVGVAPLHHQGRKGVEQEALLPATVAERAPPGPRADPALRVRRPGPLPQFRGERHRGPLHDEGPYPCRGQDHGAESTPGHRLEPRPGADGVGSGLRERRGLDGFRSEGRGSQGARGVEGRRGGCRGPGEPTSYRRVPRSGQPEGRAGRVAGPARGAEIRIPCGRTGMPGWSAPSVMPGAHS